MKASLLCVLCLSASLAYAQTSDPGSSIQISVGAAVGSLFSGQQHTFVRNALTPTPDSVDYFAGQVDLRAYLTKYIGTEVSSDFLSLTSASYGQYGADQVDAFHTSIISAGLLFRFPRTVVNSDPFDVFLGGGANYNFMSYADGFDQHYTDSIQGGVGYYGKGGVTLYFLTPVFFTAELEIQQLTDQRGDGTTFNGDYFTVNVQFGVEL